VKCLLLLAEQLFQRGGGMGWGMSGQVMAAGMAALAMQQSLGSSRLYRRSWRLEAQGKSSDVFVPSQGASPARHPKTSRQASVDWGDHEM
jgi:hypothetical protein